LPVIEEVIEAEDALVVPITDDRLVAATVRELGS